MNAADINKVTKILKGLIHNSILNSVNNVVKKCIALRRIPQEPDFIASLVLNFTPELYNILKTVFPKCKFAVTGVFCHQKPIVDIGLSKDPEIGDLLIVYIYTDQTGSKYFNSILFQAKISTYTTTTISKADDHQLILYSKWPIFIYKRAGLLNGTSRDILPKAINDGAQYLLIDNHPIYGLSGLKNTFPMGCATPSRKLSINNDLTSEIIDFLKFKSGRPFEENAASTKDEWSKMIWDLLNITKAKASRRKNLGIANFPRQETYKFDGCCFLAMETPSIFDDLSIEIGSGDIKENADNYFDEDNISTSLILIECTEIEQNEEE